MPDGTQSVHAERLAYGGPGMLWTAPTGNIDSTYAPAVSGSRFTQGITPTDVPGDSAFLPVGDLGAATSIDYTITVEEIDVENSYEVVANIVTKRVLSIKFTMSDLNMTNYSLVMNALPSAWNGTPSATGAAKFTPPVIGQEGRIQLVWMSVACDDLIVAYQMMQVGSITEKRGKGKAGQSMWAVDMKGEMPPSTVASCLFNRFMCGASRGATLPTDV